MPTHSAQGKITSQAGDLLTTRPMRFYILPSPDNHTWDWTIEVAITRVEEQPLKNAKDLAIVLSTSERIRVMLLQMTNGLCWFQGMDNPPASIRPK